MSKDTLTITDNRTGKSYEVPIEHGTIRALDLRQIKAGADDFGLMTYDPAFTNTACLQEPDHVHRRRQGHPQLPRLPHRAARGEEHLPGDRVPHPARRAARRRAQYDAWVYNITHHTMVHENIKELMDGFRYDAHPMGMLMSTVAALSTFYPEAKDIHDPEVRRRADLPPHRQDAHPGRLRLPPLRWACPSSTRTTTSATPRTSCR